jgi:uncharacterized lipoprotein
MKILIAAALLLLLGACSSTRHCERAQPYQRAETLPPLEAVDGIEPPRSASALRIPPPPPTAVPFAVKEPDPERPERLVTRCLDVPPGIPAQELVIPDLPPEEAS